LWACLCDCGGNALVYGSHLRNGRTQSCGCYHMERLRIDPVTHGHSRREEVTGEYVVWCTMKARCLKPSHPKYKWYGGRGIKVCPEWVDDFAAFLAHVGPKPSPKHQIDRIDVNGDYAPGNVRWVTFAEQCRNRRSNLNLTVNGATKCETDWAIQYGLRPGVIRKRIRRGWPVEKAVTAPWQGTR